jgi:ribosome-associated toxin RatA of RatAB toxin-antitoxin module
MKTVSRTAIVPYSADAMFKLVADIESYPGFLPWCSDARVLERDEDSVIASIGIDYKGVRQAFTTRNRFQSGKVMEMQLVEGPFRVLRGFWRFTPLDENSCKVALDLEFEFANRLLGMAIGGVFSDIATRMVDAFCERATECYGGKV